MKLDPQLWPQFEPMIAKTFRENFVDGALKQTMIGDPRLICRAMLRVVYEVAFEQLEHGEAVQVLAEALNELNAKHAKKSS